MVVNRIQFGTPWRLISNSWEAGGTYVIVDTEKLPINHAQLKEKYGENFRHYFRELDLFKNNEAIVSHVQRLDFETNKAFVVPLGNENKLLQIRVVSTLGLNNLSNEEVLEKYKHNPEQSLFENGFTKLKCSFERTFESESGNITVFEYDYCIHGEGLEAVNTIIGQQLLDCSKNDYERMGKRIGGESLTLEPDINPYGFSVSWFPGKYLIHDLEICNPETDESIDYGFMISPTHYFGELIDYDDENFFVTLDKFFDDLDKPFLENNK